MASNTTIYVYEAGDAVIHHMFSRRNVTKMGATLSMTKAVEACTSHLRKRFPYLVMQDEVHEICETIQSSPDLDLEFIFKGAIGKGAVAFKEGLIEKEDIDDSEFRQCMIITKYIDRPDPYAQKIQKALGMEDDEET